jgi:hypothetical protein
MEAMARESWTDERLDDMKASLEQRFDAVEEHMKEGFARVDADIRDLRRMMFQGFIAMMTVTVTCFVGLAGLMLF